MEHRELDVAIAAYLMILIEPPKEEKARHAQRTGRRAVVRLALSAKNIMMGIIIPKRTWIIVTQAKAKAEDGANKLNK